MTTKTYRGSSLEELLPKIQRDLGPDALIVRQREGLVGGIGGFFAKRCVEVEVEAQAPAAEPQAVSAGRPPAAQPALPARTIFDAYDSGPLSVPGAPGNDHLRNEDLRNPVIRHMIEQAAPFTAHLEAAAHEQARVEFEPLVATGEELVPALPVEAAAGDPGWDAMRARLVELGLPENTAASLVRDAERGMRPFDREATQEELVARALARQLRIEHGWRTKRRTLALVGAAGCGKTLAAAKLCHAFAAGSRLAVRTLSLEPAASAYRLGTLTEHLDIGLRVAESPEAVARAATRMQGESLIVIDTPPLSPSDPEGIERLSELLSEAKPDETHMVLPATMDARAAGRLFEAITARIPVNRLLITRLDEAPTAGVAVGLSFALKRPVSYLAEGRRPNAGLRPAEAAELAGLVLR